MKELYAVIVILFTLAGNSYGQVGQCNKMNRCSCTYEDGVVVDLRGVAKTDGTPE